MFIICKNCGFHGGDYEECHLLGCEEEPRGVTFEKRALFIFIIFYIVLGYIAALQRAVPLFEESYR
jgi:hypothetical protein